MCLDEKRRHGVISIILSFSICKLLLKNDFGFSRPLLDRLLNGWIEIKSNVILRIEKEMGHRLLGGVQTTSSPPPGRVWKSSSPSGAPVNPITGGGGKSAHLCVVFLICTKTFCASAMKFGDFSSPFIGRIVPKFCLPAFRRGGSMDFLWRYFSLNFEFSDIFHRSAHCWGLQ